MSQQNPDQIIKKMPQENENLLKTPIMKAPSLLHSKRFLVITLMLLCQMKSSFIRLNISIAVVEMTSAKEIKIGNLTVTRPPEFDWDSTTIGSVLSMFYYAGLISFIGGYITTKLGGATSCALFSMISGLTTVLQPISLYWGFYTFLLTRFLTGISESFVTIAITVVCSIWIPKNERGKLMAYMSTGMGIGVSLVHTVCGYLANIWGWQMIFYVTGTMSLVASLLCFILIKNQPSDDKWISEAELMYIEHEQENTSSAVKVSRKTMINLYRNILLSAPIWALFMISFINTAIFSFYGTLIPLYVKDSTGDNTDLVGILSSIPNVASMLTIPLCGLLLNYSRKINIPLTLIHKVLLSGSYVLSAVLLIMVVMIPSFTASMILLSLTAVPSSAVNLLISIIIISIAPNSSGIIAGINSVVSSISSISARNIMGYMTQNRTVEEWNHCFILASVTLMFGSAVFAFYGSSDPQPWSLKSELSDREDEQTSSTKLKTTK